MEIIQQLMSLSPLQLLLVVFLAFLPVIFWTSMWFKKGQEESKNILFVFFLGTLTVLPFLGLELFWAAHPSFDIYAIIDENIDSLMYWYLVTYMLAGALEEIVKGGVIYYIDFTTIEIKTINNCIRYNILIALGFAFSENILYFYTNLGQDTGAFTGIVLFRSLFTVCAHMVFSSITGYYYGVSKFSDPIVKQEMWEGRSHRWIKKIAFWLEKDPRSILPVLKFWTGMTIAMVMHGAFNISLVNGKVWLASLIVVFGFLYVRYLNSRQSGNLVLAMTGSKRNSLMAPRDEDVVIELMGMWMNEGKYKEVQEICERLLKRDPDNRVVKLFQAKASDKAGLKEMLSGVMRGKI